MTIKLEGDDSVVVEANGTKLKVISHKEGGIAVEILTDESQVPTRFFDCFDHSGERLTKVWACY